MDAIFLEEWKAYRAGLKRPAFAGEQPRGEAAFEGPVKVGEIRIFADANRPFVALIAEDCGLAGRRIIPVSPFSSPASARERKVGPRVFQLWNACVASRRFTDRSWRVDVVAPEALSEILKALPSVFPGRVLAGDGIQARYEREFLVSGGNFIPFARRVAEPQMTISRWLYSGWGVAASIAVFFGAFVVLSASDRDINGRHCWKNPFAFAYVASAEPELASDETWETVELIEPEVVQDESAAIAAAVRPRLEVPSLPAPYRDDVSVRPWDVAHRQDRKVRELEISLDEGFISPAKTPCDCLAASVAADGQKGEFTYSASPLPTIAKPGAVVCTVTECPWNSSRRLLNVVAADAKGLRVEVRFNRQVFGYRLLSETKGESINAFYEIVPQPLSGFVPAEALTVTTRWCDAAGEQSRVETVREASPRTLRGLPEQPRKASGTGSTSPDDVSVDINFPAR